ncbi:MAG TPA: DUF2231 domain-containing protein [Anaerolineales bacterium]|nr:DUF2231 domain-containing protein [Anaerolineales bacterium]
MVDFLQGKWLKHPLHPALVHVPTALWPSAFAFDLFSQFRAENAFVQLAFYAILLGLIFALMAIPTGYADWTDIKPEKPAWKLGLYHMILNAIVSILWGISLALRVRGLQTASSVSLGLLGLSALATVLLLVSGYLGGRMIYAYGINVARLSKKKWRTIAQDGGAAVPPEEGE